VEVSARPSISAARMFARAGSPTRAGVTKDYEKALEWYRKAAEQNEPLAQANRGDVRAWLWRDEGL
jgi:TPR repeat protein